MPRNTRPTIQAGTLRRPLSIEHQISGAAGASNRPNRPWATYIDRLYGRVEEKGVLMRGPGTVPLAGGLGMGDATFVTTIKVTVRCPPGLRPAIGMRVVDGDQRYNIQSVENTDQRDRELILRCTLQA